MLQLFRYSLLVFALCWCVSGQGQSYEKRLAGSGTDYPSCMQLLADEGVLIGGATGSFGNGGTDMFITRLDMAGNTVWNKAVGTTADDTCASLAITTDSCIVACGNTYGGGLGNSDLYVVKLDMSGQLLWSKVLGQVNYDYAVKVLPTSDSGFVMCGYINYPPVLMPVIGSGTRANSFLMKFDANGNVQWTQYYGTLTCHYRIYDLFGMVNGDYIILLTSTCQSNPPNYQSNSMCMRVDSAGQMLWLKSGFPTGFAYSYAILPQSDNGMLVAYGGGGGISELVKIDSTGAVVNGWRYGYFTDMQLFSIYDLPGDGYLLIGSVTPYQLAENGLMFFRIGNNGYPISTTWKRLETPLLPYNALRSVMRPSDSHITMTIGVFQQMLDVAVLTVDTTGQTVCNDDSLLTVYTNLAQLPPFTTEPMVNNPPSMLNGTAVTNVMAFNFAVASVCSASNGIADGNEAQRVDLAPNPAHETVRISWTGEGNQTRTVKVMNTLGEIVYTTPFTGVSDDLDVSFLSPGTYLLIFEANGAVCETRKLIRD